MKQRQHKPHWIKVNSLVSAKVLVLIYVGGATAWFLCVNTLLFFTDLDIARVQLIRSISDFIFILISAALINIGVRGFLSRCTEEIVQLKQSEESLTCVLAGSQLGFWDWDFTTNKINRNAIWAEMLGYSFDDIAFTTQQWTDFVHPDDRERAWDSINAVLEGKSLEHQMVYRMKTKAGQYKWIFPVITVF